MDDVAIRLDDVWVRYGEVTILESIDLTIRRRDFLCLMGPNGGGKTTLLKVILGLIKPTHGRVSVLGDRPERKRRFIGYVPQISRFNYDFPITVLDVVLMGRIRHAGLLRRYSAEDRESAYRAIEAVDMLNYIDKKVSDLSGGEIRRVLIARALAVNPEILLLDEPMVSLDKSTKTKIYELLKDLNEDRKVTIILVSHDISAAPTYAEKIAILNRRILYYGSKEDGWRLLEEAYGDHMNLAVKLPDYRSD